MKRYKQDQSGELYEHENGEWVGHAEAAAIERDRDNAMIEMVNQKAIIRKIERERDRLAARVLKIEKALRDSRSCVGCYRWVGSPKSACFECSRSKEDYFEKYRGEKEEHHV